MMDAPEIRRTEETGYPRPVKHPVCPICGYECDTIYKDVYGEVVACDNCMVTLDAWEWSRE